MTAAGEGVRNGDAKAEQNGKTPHRRTFPRHKHSHNPPNVAAGVMLHAEAGGYTSYVDGGSYKPLMGANHLISAPNKDAWEYLRDNLCAKID